MNPKGFLKDSYGSPDCHGMPAALTVACDLGCLSDWLPVVGFDVGLVACGSVACGAGCLWLG